jgi:pyruvate, orthophosphate dikinase
MAAFGEPARLSLDAVETYSGEDRIRLLGSKAAALSRMIGLGLPVPVGFAMTTALCRRYLASGWEAGMSQALLDGLTELEASTGKRLGDPDLPLLVSVRSGAAVSMPGMMDTVLNVGMTEAIAERLGVLTNNEFFAWDSMRRFLQSYATVVLDVPQASLGRWVTEEFRANKSGLASAVMSLRDRLSREGYEVPSDPILQVRESVKAVFRSWNAERAQSYRKIEGIDDSLGTAATIQSMVFGNLDSSSGTGVAFSRCPSTGRPEMTGDILVNAQGEDVVAGTHTTLPLQELRTIWADLADELEVCVKLLEREFRDLVDVEFTIESGTLWLLQARVGKRTPHAALRIALDMAEDEDFPLDRREAVRRVAHILQEPPMVTVSEADPRRETVALGLGASPGLASGSAMFDVDEAVAAHARGESVILFRPTTSPDDVVAMANAAGIVTARGGLMSHAAVVARSWGLPAIVGVGCLTFGHGFARLGSKEIPAGTRVTIDGDSGEIFLGDLPGRQVLVPEAAVLAEWQRTISSAYEGENPSHGTEDATPASVERVFAIKGMATVNQVAAVLAAPAASVEIIVEELIQAGDLLALPGGRFRPGPQVTDRVREQYTREASVVASDIARVMPEFDELNLAFKELITAWQLRSVDGQLTPNDHSDRDYDRRIVESLRQAVHPQITMLLGRLSEYVARLSHYIDRFGAALDGIEAGKYDMVANPLKDSYHTVWFELHEELIRLAGWTRAEVEEFGDSKQSASPS